MSPGPDLSAATWRKSSYSDGGANNCVEVSDTFPGLVPVRDSKTPTAPALTFDPPPGPRSSRTSGRSTRREPRPRAKSGCFGRSCGVMIAGWHPPTPTAAPESTPRS